MSSFSVSRGVSPGITRWGWLPLSVALNLLLVGLILGWASDRPQPRQALVTWQRDLLPALPSTDVAIVGGATDRIAAAQAAGDMSVHAAYSKIRATLAVEPVDRAALMSSFDAIRAAREAQQSTVYNSFLEELTSVSPAGRAMILKAMEAESHRWHPPGGH